MHFTSENHIDDIVERNFILGGIRGILWTPRAAGTIRSIPLVLAGQPGGPASLDQTRSRLFPRAQRAAAAGIATATIELPGSGKRPEPDGVAQARIEMREAVTTGQPVTDSVIDRLVLPLVDQAVPDWQATLDALLAMPEFDGRIGYAGGVVSIGIRLAATDPRIAAAALFAGSFVPRSILEQARRVTIPVHVLLQWDDEGNDRNMALQLFDAFGSHDKTLNANMGGHTGVPQHAAEEANRFLARHLLTPSTT
jgi:dienelactone hydrolase